MLIVSHFKWDCLFSCQLVIHQIHKSANTTQELVQIINLLVEMPACELTAPFRAELLTHSFN